MAKKSKFTCPEEKKNRLEELMATLEPKKIQLWGQ